MAKVVKGVVGLVLIASALVLLSVGVPLGMAVPGLFGGLFTASAGTLLLAGAALTYSALSSSAFNAANLDAASQSGQKFVLRGRTDTQKLVMGFNRIGGAEVAADETSTDNKTLILARVVADHEVDSFGDFYLNNEVVSFDGAGNAIGTYANFLYLKTYDGSQTTADPWLLTTDGWTANDIGYDTSYYVIKAIFDGEKFPYGASELMNVSIEVYGAKFYDPRLDSTMPGGSGAHRILTPSTWEYSTNVFVAAYNMLYSTLLGHQVPQDEIGHDEAVAAMDVADETVTYKDATTGSRYTAHGVFDTAQDKQRNILALVQSAGMGYMVGGEGGLFRFYAGEQAIASETFDDDHIFSTVFNDTPPQYPLINEVVGTYIDPDQNFEAVEYPPIVDAAAQATDGPEPFTLNFPFTHDHRDVQRLTSIYLKRARASTITIKGTPALMTVATAAAFGVDDPDIGLTAAGGDVFRVMQKTISQKNKSVDLTGRRESAALYAWTAASDEQDPATPLPLGQATGRETELPTGVVATPATQTGGDGDTQPIMTVDWTAPDTLVNHTLVDWRVNGETDWIPQGLAVRGETSTYFPIPSNTDIDVRVRHVMQSGVISTAVEVLATTTGSAMVAAAGWPTENLLGVDAGPTHSDTYYWWNLKPIADCPFDVGDVISGGSLLSSTNADIVNFRFMIEFRDGASTHVGSSPHNGNYLSGVFADSLSYLENIEVPVGTTQVNVLAFASSGTSADASERQAMLNRGPKALPYVKAVEDGSTVGGAWDVNITARPTELTDGRIPAGFTSAGALNQNIAYGILYNDSGDTGRLPLTGLDFDTASDGDAVTFPVAYNSIPNVQFQPGGITSDSGLTGDLAKAFDPVDVTVSGFTASLLLKELAGTPALHTDTGAVVGATYDYELEKVTTTPDNAWNNTYEAQVDVTVTNVDVGGGEYTPGQCEIGFYIKTTSGGSWVKYGNKTVYGAPGLNATTTRLDQTISATVSGVTDFAGVQFAVNVESSSPAGSVLTALDSVSYSTATAPAEASATPTGASPIPYKVYV